VPRQNGGLARLDNLVQLVQTKTASRIDRLDRQRQVSLRAAVAPGFAQADRIEALRAEVAKIARDGIGEAELARVKTQWVASETYKLDSVMAQARELGSNWVQGLPLDASARIIDRLQGVTAAQVQAVAAKYFGDDQLTAAVLHPLPPETARRPRGSAVPAGDLR